MVSWWTTATEIGALARTALSMPLEALLPVDQFDGDAPHPTPVVLVHGLFGHPTNFLTLANALSARGIRNLATFRYTPRLDYPRLAAALRHRIDAIRAATGVAAVDVVGHSLGGLVARYLIETGDGALVRRLTTIGAPYYAGALPPCELAIFAGQDALVPVPDRRRGPQGHILVVPDCGHVGLLYHPAVLAAVTSFLSVLPARTKEPSSPRVRAAA